MTENLEPCFHRVGLIASSELDQFVRNDEPHHQWTNSPPPHEFIRVRRVGLHTDDNGARRRLQVRQADGQVRNCDTRAPGRRDCVFKRHCDGRAPDDESETSSGQPVHGASVVALAKTRTRRPAQAAATQLPGRAAYVHVCARNQDRLAGVQGAAANFVHGTR